MKQRNLVRVNFTLPRNVYMSLKASVPERKRSQLVARLIESELAKREDALYEAAKAVEKDKALNREMKDWEMTLDDGLGETAWK